MPLIASLLDQSATAFGLTAAAIAVVGFVAHAGPALSGAEESRLRAITVRGGLVGCTVSVGIIVLSALGA